MTLTWLAWCCDDADGVTELGVDSVDENAEQPDGEGEGGGRGDSDIDGVWPESWIVLLNDS